MVLVFNPDMPKSPDGGALYHSATLMSQLASFQALSETTSAADALEKIVIGVDGGPHDDNRYTISELQNKFCTCQMYPPFESGKQLSIGDGQPDALVSGVIETIIRRIVRPSEVDSDAKRNNLYLAFYDHICWLEKQFLETANQAECPRARFIQPMIEAAFNELEEETAQGEYLFAQFKILWGDLDE